MKPTKIAVMSDSHDNTGNIEKIAAIANEKGCSYLFHLGDITTTSTAGKLKAFNGMVKAVFGNCDGEHAGLRRILNTFGGEIERPPLTFNLENKKIILMHEPVMLQEFIKAGDADFLFYGHLHKTDVQQYGKTLVINPGDSGGGVRKASFFIIDLQTGEFEHIEI